MANLIQRVQSKAFELLPNFGGVKGNVTGIPKVENSAHSPRNFMIPLQMERIKTDVESWRLAITESENAYYPHRFRMQQLMVDVILEGHTMACIKKRKSMTLLKEFKIGKKNDEGIWTENIEATKLFKKKWFKELLSYGLDAQFYGYSLIQLGDLINKGKEYNFENLTILKRWNVSPDRKQLVQIPYQTWGLGIEPVKAHDKENAIKFSEDVDENGVPFDDWMVYVDTPSDVGSSICGFGLLYNVALYSIILKSNLSFNSAYNQMFVAPYRHIKTDEKFDSDEYKQLQRSAAQMGAFGYLLTGSSDEVEFIQGNTGTGFQSYADLEKRCQASISKLILGHADALDSRSTALGGGGGGKKVEDEESTPEGKALAETEKEQDTFALSFLNDICFPKFKKLGFPIKDDECFYTNNDKEDDMIVAKKNAKNKEVAEIAQTMKSAGLQMDAKHFEEVTQIPTKEVETPSPYPQGKSTFVQGKLKALYNGKV